MAETIRVFACPKCGLIIEQGTNPCPYCKTPIAWEGMEQPEQPMQPEQQQTQVSYSPGEVSGVSEQMTQVAPPTPETTPIPEAQASGFSYAAQTQASAAAPLFQSSPSLMQTQAQTQAPTQAELSQAPQATMPEDTTSYVSAPQTAGFRTPLVEVDHAALNDPAAAYNSRSASTFVPASAEAPSNDQLLAAATSPVLDSIDYAAQDTLSSESTPQASSLQASTFQFGTAASPYGREGERVDLEPISLSQQHAAPSLQVESLQQMVASQPQVEVEAPQMSQSAAQSSVASMLTPAPTLTPAPAPAPAVPPTPSPTSEFVPTLEYTPTHTVDLASQVEPVFTAAAETDTQRVPDATAPATSGKVGQESEATLAPAPTAAVTAATVAATSAAAAAATKPAPTPAPTAGSSSTTSALPENPPIKQAGMDYYPTRKTKKSKGARAVSIVMKVIAVLVWIAAIAILIGARDVLGAAFNPFSFDALVDVLTNNETVKSGISFIIFGFLFFGVAVIIGLLGDIRRGVR